MIYYDLKMCFNKKLSTKEVVMDKNIIHFLKSISKFVFSTKLHFQTYGEWVRGFDNVFGQCAFYNTIFRNILFPDTLTLVYFLPLENNNLNVSEAQHV